MRGKGFDFVCKTSVELKTCWTIVLLSISYPEAGILRTLTTVFGVDQ